MSSRKPRWLDRRIAAPGPHLALCTSEGEFRAALRHLKFREPIPFLGSSRADATTHTLECDGRIVCLVTLGDVLDRSPVEVAGLLVHEAVHVWQTYCDSIGEANPAREQEAYGIQAIAQELMAEYAEKAASWR